MKLSIITINYNNLDGLRKTIDSVINQTWQDFEWIIVDGGSTDGSKELIEETVKACAKITFWCSEPDKGVYNAMNKGIVQAHGEYMNFMNSGDTFYDELVLEKVFKEPHEADVLYGQWYWCSSEKEIHACYEKEANIGTFYIHNICHQAMFIRSSILHEDGYDESLRLYSDWARWMKLACNGGTFESLPILICRFALGGLSGQDPALAERETAIIRNIPPHNILGLLDSYRNNSIKLNKYENCYLTKEILALANESPWYFRLFHLSLIVVRFVKYISGSVKHKNSN